MITSLHLGAGNGAVGTGGHALSLGLALQGVQAGADGAALVVGLIPLAQASLGVTGNLAVGVSLLAVVLACAIPQTGRDGGTGRVERQLGALVHTVAEAVAGAVSRGIAGGEGGARVGTLLGTLVVGALSVAT